MKSSVTDLLGSSLEIAVNQTAIAAITGYQKYISPRKGFSCAYRVLNQSDSCSQHIKKLIAKYGIVGAIPLARKRLKACKNAYIILQAETEEEQRRRQRRENCRYELDNLCVDCTPTCYCPNCDIGDCGIDGCGIDGCGIDGCGMDGCDVGSCGSN